MDTGFFKWVWRFNALALAGTTAFIFIVLVSEFAGDLFREQRAPAAVNVDPEDTTVEERLEIGDVTFNADTGLLEFALLRPQTYDAGGYSSGNSKSTYNNIVNRGYMDPETGETRWLLENSDGLIVGQRLIMRGTGDDQTHVATFLRWVTQDTTGDRRLSANDAGDLYMVDPDGGELTLLANQVEGVSKTFGFDGTIQIADMTRDGQRALAFVSISRRAIVKTLGLPEF